MLYLAPTSTGAAGAAVPIELYHTTPPWSSRASPPVIHVLAVVLNRRTVRLLGCVCFSSFCHFSARVSFFFAFLLCCCTLGFIYQYAFNSTAPTRTAGERLFATRGLQLIFVTPS